MESCAIIRAAPRGDNNVKGLRAGGMALLIVRGSPSFGDAI